MSGELCPIGVKLGTDVLSLANRLLKNPITGIAVCCARGYWPTSLSFNTSLGLEDVQFQSRLRTAPVVGRIYVISDRLIHLQVAPILRAQSLRIVCENRAYAVACAEAGTRVLALAVGPSRNKTVGSRASARWLCRIAFKGSSPEGP
jgi:hypothetical protein